MRLLGQRLEADPRHWSTYRQASFALPQSLDRQPCGTILSLVLAFAGQTDSVSEIDFLEPIINDLQTMS
jgi:hypothetical protein